MGRPALEITEEMFVAALGEERDNEMRNKYMLEKRRWFADTLKGHGKEVVFMESMRGLVDGGVSV